jgi:SAM-dependent methyltransferase
VKRSSPAAERNREPIAEVLREVLPPQGTVLEVASGTGEHIVHFAQAFPALRWQPSDPDPEAVTSIEAWAADSRAANLLPPVYLDAASSTWPVHAADAVLCINMIHISPWGATKGLMRGVAGLLAPGAPLVLYGPYRRAGVATAASNEAFDASLRSRNPEWGLRDLDAVTAEAAAQGLDLDRVREMPANNLAVVLRRR